MSFKGSANSGVMTLFVQRISGIVLLFMLLFHFFVMHFVVKSHDITYEWVARRFANPLWKVFDESFLILALWHAFYGFKMVADDYFRSNGVRIFFITLVFILTLALFLLGSITILTFRAA